MIDNGVHKEKIVLKEVDINGLKRLEKEKPELKKHYTTIFLDIPPKIIAERIRDRGASIEADELERRIKTATLETQESEKMCDYLIDATQSPQAVLEEVLAIIEFT